MSLPEHYTPGRYRAVKIVNQGVALGYGVATPGGQLVVGATYDSRSAAAARAEKLNEIRAAMAPKKEKA